MKIMSLNFNATGSERKELVKVIGEITGLQPRYCKAPSFAYEVGGYTIDKSGAVTFGETPDEETLAEFISQLETRGFVCEKVYDLAITASEPYSAQDDTETIDETNDVSKSVRKSASYSDSDTADDTHETSDKEENSDTDVSVELNYSDDGDGEDFNKNDIQPDNTPDGETTAESGLTPISPFVSDSEIGTDKASPDDVQDGAKITETLSNADKGGLSIEIPLAGFTYSSLTNLENLVASKAWVFKKMTGAEELPIEKFQDRLSFPWFPFTSSPQEIDAYSRLISRLCETAKTKQRITAKERKQKEGDNEKFKARCTLLMLGFIGDEYSQARKILLSPFSGNGSFLKGDGKKNVPFSGGFRQSEASSIHMGDIETDGVHDAKTNAVVSYKCSECFFHCYYTDGLLRSSSGDIVDTSNRTPEKYTHYCLKTPSGFRKIKHTTEWSGIETAPKWCPQYNTGAFVQVYRDSAESEEFNN